MRRPLLGLVLLSSAACGTTGASPASPTPSTPAPPTEQANRAPVITTMSGSPAFAVAQVTNVSYTASATDADGDSLIYTWEFADGTRTTGAAVLHTYGNVFGERSTRLTVSDGRGGNASDTRPVTVGNLTGLWQGYVFTSSVGGPYWLITLSLSQGMNGATAGRCGVVGPASVERFVGTLDPDAENRIDADGRIVLRCKVYGNFDDFRIEGVMGRDTGNQIGGKVFGPGFNGDVMVFTRVFQ